MERRTFLVWATNGLGAVFGAVLGLPALGYLVAPASQPGRKTGWHTVAHFNDLKALVPAEAIIKDTRRDAWNLHPDDIVGRVWLVRQTNDDVVAFTTICPHLGCSVNWVPPPEGRPAETGEFLCPCHGGRFQQNGARVLGGGINNPAPRGMDKLLVQKIADPDSPNDMLVQVRYLRFKTMQEQQEPEQMEPDA